jgi:hypothetical protein
MKSYKLVQVFIFTKICANFLIRFDALSVLQIREITIIQK